MDIEYLLHLFILKRYVADPWYEVDSLPGEPLGKGSFGVTWWTREVRQYQKL